MPNSYPKIRLAKVIGTLFAAKQPISELQYICYRSPSEGKTQMRSNNLILPMKLITSKIEVKTQHNSSSLAKLVFL